MTAAKVFPVGTSISEVMGIICGNADEVVKGAIIGMFSMMVLGPSCGINVSTVIGVTIGDTIMDGYMVSVTPTVGMASEPYETVCANSIIQRFIGVDDTGRAVKFAPVGNQFEGLSGLLN